MATVKPFAALRPLPELASRVCELPYDVMSSDEAREIALGNPFSFLRVSKPEIDLPATLDPHDPKVYAKGKANFAKFIAEGVLRQDARPGFYLYRQTQGAHSQIGLAGVVSCEEYLRNIIRKHELTRPDKEDDRVRHIEALNSQTGPAFLIYPAQAALDDLFARQVKQPPEIDFTAKDGVRHACWVVSEQRDIDFIQQTFDGVRYLYIADGHHRSAAAVRVYQNRKSAGNSRYFLAVIFPHNQVQILPYHRVLTYFNGHTSQALLQKLDAIFLIQEPGVAQATRPHELGLYLEGRWRTLTFRPKFVSSRDPLDQLDATLLQKHVLGPIFGIEDPRTDQRIQFVGGIRGTAELEKRVNSGEQACAFSMYPTRVEDLLAIADAGGIMPPKSTWFEPKLRDAMFCHML